VVAEPVRALIRGTQSVIADRDYALRVVRETDDEVGQLVDSFNAMLGEIERREAELRDSEQRFRQVTETIDEVFWLEELPGRRMLYVSPSYERVWGRPRATVSPSRTAVEAPTVWSDAIHAEDRARVVEAMRSATDYEVEYRVVQPSGAIRWVVDRGFVVRDASGQPYRRTGVVRDVTLRREAERALADSVSLNRHIIEASPVGMVAYRADGPCIFSNPAIAAIVGATREQVERQNFRQIAPWAQNGMLDLALATLRDGEVRLRSVHFRTTFGKEVWLDCTFNRFVRDGVTCLLVLVQDMTRRRQAELALRESEERFRSAFESAPMVMTLSALDGRFVRVNEAFCALFGFTVAEALERSVFDVVPVGERAGTSAELDDLVTGRVGQYDRERQLVCHNGRVVWGRVGATILRDAHGAPQFLLCQVQDITARKEAERKLLDHQTQLQALLDAVPDLMFRVRADGVILDFHAHDPRELYVPAEQIIGRRFVDLLPRDVARQINEVIGRTLAAGQLQALEYAQPMPAGTQAYEGRVVPSGANEVTMIVRNVTDRRRLERQLLEVSEHEQRRIGQDIHDGLCQQLVGVGFMVRLLEQRLQASGSPQADAVREIATHLHQALNDARQVSHGLHPVRLDEEGLGLALRELAEQVTKTGAVACAFDYPEVVPVPDNNVATHLYRIAQEAVSNALKHGNPRQIIISLTQEEEMLELRIEDDGVGLGLAPGATPNGIGLQVMQYRARMIGGTLDLAPRIAGGTMVTCVCRRRG
jgi:PAS domain S-box-containing protein